MTSDPHGYDPATDTVRVRRHDLARLLLTFRDLAATGGPGSWSHMTDYDISFERLADIVDDASRRFYGRRWEVPDYRMRCDRSSAYRWPDSAPYDGGEVVAVRVIEASRTDRGSHYVPAPMGEWPETLCGISFTPQEAKPIEDEPDCTACRRELDLAKQLPAIM